MLTLPDKPRAEVTMDWLIALKAELDKASDDARHGRANVSLARIITCAAAVQQVLDINKSTEQFK